MEVAALTRSEGGPEPGEIWRRVSRRWGAIVLAFLLLMPMGCGGSAAGRSDAPSKLVPDTGLLVSQYRDRRLARPLSGATLRGEAYVFLDAEPGTVSVEFSVAARDGYEGLYRHERLAPYDMGGTDDVLPEQPAQPLDTRSMPDGTHTVVVTATFEGGDTKQYGAVFDVWNGSDALLPADIYVSVDGDDDSDGSAARPFATIQKALNEASPGDVIYVREGTYAPTDSLRISRSGRPDAPIRLMGHPGEQVVISGERLRGDTPVLRLNAHHWVVKDLDVRDGPYFGILVEHAEHNHFEDVRVYRNDGSGLHLDRGASFNSFVRVDAFENYDVDTGGSNADGIAVKHRTAVSNLFLEVRAWNNSDDGFDLLESGPQRIDRSQAFLNGYMPNGDPYPDGDGNGFKLGIGQGRWQAGGGHTVTRSVAWSNLTWGFNSNNGTVPITLYNNTSYANGVENYLFNKAKHVLVNNLSYEGRVVITGEVKERNNSWQLGIREPGFISMDPESPDFLRLSPESPALEAGVDVGLEFTGSAPSLGAYQAGD